MVDHRHQERSLGTLLRHLVHLLDGDVERVYAKLDLPFRSRYTPVVKSLLLRERGSIKQIAADVGLSHSALSQTISQMTKDGLVTAEAGVDGRERLIRLTPAARALLPRVFESWTAFDTASNGLSDEIGVSLASMCEQAIAALESRSFEDRVAEIMAPKRSRSKAARARSATKR